MIRQNFLVDLLHRNKLAVTSMKKLTRSCLPIDAETWSEIKKVFVVCLIASFLAVTTTVSTTAVAQVPTRPEAPTAQPPAVKPNAVKPAAPGTPAPAQTAPAPKPPAPPAATLGAGAKAKPAMQTLELMTKDGVKLRAFYFPSDKGKEAVPVIVVHEWEGQASPYLALVKSLNNAGCAVIVPELRGHGGSRENGPAGKPFDIARMGKVDVANIIGGDMEAVKSHLRRENDEGKLNLNALVLIGVRQGAVIAAHWAVGDLNFPSIGKLKQGQDVKALVLISPEKTLKGYSLDETLRDRLLWQLPFLVIVGQTSPQFPDTDRFYKRLDSMKKKATKGLAVNLELDAVATSLSGHALVTESPGVIDKVTGFLKTQLIDRSAKIPWVDRE